MLRIARFALPLLTVLAIVAVPIASAGTHYSGTLSSSSPTGECSAYSGSATGFACDGWNNWDYSRLYFNSGGTAKWGFIFNDGTNNMYIKSSGSVSAGTTVTVVWNDGIFSSPTHYNRPGCTGAGTGSSPNVNCISLIF